MLATGQLLLSLGDHVPRSQHPRAVLELVGDEDLAIEPEPAERHPASLIGLK